MRSSSTASVERGSELAVPRAALPPLEPDSYYVTDLLGLSVFEDGGRGLGVVAGRAPRPGERRVGARLGTPAPARRGLRPLGRRRRTPDRGCPRVRGRPVTSPRASAPRRLHAGSRRVRLDARAPAARGHPRHRARSPHLQLPRHHAADGRTGRRRAVRRRSRDGVARGRRRCGARRRCTGERPSTGSSR